MSVSPPQLLLAAPAASGGYTAPGVVYNSLGKFASTTQLNANVPLDNLFPDITGPQNAAQQVDYQCLFFYNTDTTFTLTSVTAWLPSSGIQTSAIDWAVGADTTMPMPFTSTTPQAGFITSPLVAPTTVTSFAPPIAQLPGGVSLGSIAPSHVAAFWIRRTATGSTDASGEPVLAGFNIQVTFDVTISS
jgi:hypothetical protein